MMRAARIACLCAALLGLAACSVLGTAPSQPEGVPHGGIGLFRIMSADETNVPPSPTGATVVVRNFGMESGMVAGDHLFYAGAPELAEHGDPDPMLPDGAVDWSFFEARRIYRASPRSAERDIGFDPGGEILAASEAWEGGFLRDPWAIVLEGGRTLLYYAAEGGIGVAEAMTVGGVFDRVGSAPIIPASAGATPARPSVVPTAGLEGAPPGFFMFFERGGAIVQAHSEDGLAWTEIGELDLPAMPARDERDGVEIAQEGPGAVVAQTEAGRAVLRLYYVSRRDVGPLVTLAASFDGSTYVTLDRPVSDRRDVTHPAPRVIDPRISFLYVRAPRESRGVEQGGLLVGIAPGTVTWTRP